MFTGCKLVLGYSGLRTFDDKNLEEDGMHDVDDDDMHDDSDFDEEKGDMEKE